MRPLIFISNDDGIQAKGVKELIEMVSPLGDVIAVVPDGPRSGAACAITSIEPLRLKLVEQREGVKVYACSGTPVDCVKLGLEQAVTRCPDLVLSGINHGDNSSVNVHYSGTMGVALEGCMKGIPSVGFSLQDTAQDADFKPCADVVQRICRQVLAERLPLGTCLNVNFPKGGGYQGVKVCRMAKGSWSNEWCCQRHPRGYDYYWLTGKFTNDEPESTDTDLWALAHQYVAVTPIHTDLTDQLQLRKMADWNL